MFRVTGILRWSGSRSGRSFLTALGLIGVLGVFVGAAAAVTPMPGWEVTARTYPTNIPPSGSGIIAIDVYNTGALSTNGPITVTETLPSGLTATSAGELLRQAGIGHSLWNCSGSAVVTCTSNATTLPSIGTGQVEELGIEVDAGAGPSRLENNLVTVAGGGAAEAASRVNPIEISSTPAPFGIAGLDGWFTNVDGTPDTQAGSHPYDMTVSLDLNTALDPTGENAAEPSSGEVRNIEVKLPPGLIGDPNAIPQCTREALDLADCPAVSQIGVIEVGLGWNSHPLTFFFSVFNMVPPPGVPAQFAFTLQGVTTFIDAGVRSDGDYGITVHVNNIAQRQIISSRLTLWGVPGDPSHDPKRCANLRGTNTCGLSSGAGAKPFLTLPTSCVGPQTFSAYANTWENSETGEATYVSHDSGGNATGITGCDRLGFAPSISAAPDTVDADTPAGLTVELKVPQEGLASTEGLATSNIEDTNVILPQGVVINPGQAAGLVACQPNEDGVGTEGPASCPAASRVGTVSITTPLLPDKLEGDVYVLQSNPPDLQLLVAASADGVNLKLVGDVHLNETTGQLSTTFSNTPELPFTDFKLSFSGGAQAALATPTMCGVYSTISDFTPWASPSLPDLSTVNSFGIERGTGGAACPPSLPFAPSLIAGSTTDQAGGFTSFSLLLQRGDDQQRVSSLQFKVPEGLLGMISKVPLCQEPQAEQGTCSSLSQIGHTVVAAGPGPYPLVVPESGQAPAPIYLTGGYQGAPYGLSIAVPVIAGPFNLGTVVVRSRIEVDPYTAQLTVTTDPLPSILDGIPTDLRTINAVIDRPGFMFNPTDCSPKSFSGTAFSTEGAQAAISSHFQMGSCQSLTFKPNFKVSTSGRTSRANGASLDAKIVYPTTPLGNNQASSQANIASVKVDLPKQLPSRLTTLQRACPVQTFDANPARCPTASIVGHATAITPVLPVALTGPAYFVSHAGESFPQLIVVLQGYGVTVNLVGDTFISKTAITSSTFKQVPDVPITSFELKLPQGKYSALAANGNLCKAKLEMPTAFVGHNGATIHQITPVTVSGCAKARKKTKAHHADEHHNK